MNAVRARPGACEPRSAARHVACVRRSRLATVASACSSSGSGNGSSAAAARLCGSAALLLHSCCSAPLCHHRHQQQHHQQQGQRRRPFASLVRATPSDAPGAAAGGDDDDAPPAAMTVTDARGLLGVGSAATFDDVVAAKNRKLAELAAGDDDGRLRVEAAYDVLFMASMKSRITGELQVPTRVRYADVPQAAKKRGGGGGGGGSRGSGSGGGGGGAGAPALLPGGFGIAAPTKPGAAAAQAAVFAALMAWALAGAVTQPPEAQAAETGGLQLALAGAWAIYQLRDAKRVSFGRAAGITAASMVAGIMLGAALNAWLQVDVVPIGPLASPGVFVTEFGILAMGAGCLLLA